MTDENSAYLFADQPAELERLRLQARVWEPAGQALVAQLPAGSGCRALDVGCGAMGWLRVLSDWVGPAGTVVGTDMDDAMLAAARTFIEAEGLGNVELRKDDVFSTRLEPGSFDILHSRFLITPLGRAGEQIDTYRRLLKPGGWLVMEDPDGASWRVNPDAPGVHRLIDLIKDGFRHAGGNFDSGRELPDLFRELGPEPRVSAHVMALPPGHPYLHLPLQFATSLASRLETIVGEAELRALTQRARIELERPGTWGTTFTLIQACAPLSA